MEGHCPAGRGNNWAISMGIHSLNCSLRSDRIAPHHHLRNLIFDAAQMAALAPLKEPMDLISGHGGYGLPMSSSPSGLTGRGSVLTLLSPTHSKMPQLPNVPRQGTT